MSTNSDDVDSAIAPNGHGDRDRGKVSMSYRREDSTERTQGRDSI